ncbi:hypothetical protein CUP0813 [Campylobacter upsaliensis RM3195]|nr:hypothetical protein CUP0813 [Campylobacter upsaliensis RM3195]
MQKELFSLSTITPYNSFNNRTFVLILWKVLPKIS